MRVSHRQLIIQNPPNSYEIGGFFYALKMIKKSKNENQSLISPRNQELSCLLACFKAVLKPSSSVG
ncbi:hypothetical protein F7P75_13035 [Acinetobacter gandensis]|nr:hypothetical protein F7P75_13035 [Acinetobacter gandensis]